MAGFIITVIVIALLIGLVIFISHLWFEEGIALWPKRGERNTLKKISFKLDEIDMKKKDCYDKLERIVTAIDGMPKASFAGERYKDDLLKRVKYKKQKSYIDTI